MIQKKRFRFGWRFQLHCIEKSKGPKKFMNRFFVEIGPPKNPIIFCISPKFLPLTCKILKKCTKKAKIVVYILQRLKIGRTFENMEKIIGFSGGRIWAKNRFMNFIWPLRTIYPQIWNICLNGIFAFRKNDTTCGKYSVAGRTF